jgi:hypothetical protein
VHQRFIGFKKVRDSVRREVLYNILIEFGIPMKLLGITETCLNETYSRVRVGRHLSDMFHVKNDLKQLGCTPTESSPNKFARIQ